MTRTKTPYLPTYCRRQSPGSVPHLPTYSQAAGGAAVPGAATAGAAAAHVSAGVPAAGDSPGMAPFAAKRAVSRASEAVFYPPPPPPTHHHHHLPTYLLRGPLGRSKPDLPTYCMGSNRGGQTPYLARSE